MLNLRGEIMFIPSFLYCTRFDGKPSDIREWLPIIKQTAGDTKFAIVETSWTAEDEYGGGEGVQADYVYEVFCMKDYFGEQLEYVCWFTECDLIEDAFRGLKLFRQSGLISYEGVEREAWWKWVELAEKKQ